MNHLFYRNRLWQYAFEDPASPLHEEDREQLIKDTLDSYLDELDKNETKGEFYEGEITATGKYLLLGAFGGYQFKINYECTTFDTTQYASILIGKPINPQLN